jgi:hypothetical protein
MAKKSKATQTNHEWNIDVLAAQSITNFAVEGDNPTNITITPTVRRGNYCQISTKTIQISGTSQAVVAAGGTNKMGYQLLQRSKELKRDIEGSLTTNVAKAAGSSSTARKSAGLPCWLASNVDFLAAGANPTGSPPDGTVARTDGTAAAVTEARVKNMLQLVYSSSGDSPDYLLVSPKNKQNVSAFTGQGTRFTHVDDNTLMTAFDIYQSDFGDVKVVPDIFLARSKDMFAINPNYISVAYLRPFQTLDLARTGDSLQKELVVEYTLQVSNEKAHGAVYDTLG